MTDYIIIAVLIIIVGAASAYLVRAKKRGVKCVGCPDGATCSSKCGGECHCCSQPGNDEK